MLIYVAFDIIRSEDVCGLNVNISIIYLDSLGLSVTFASILARFLFLDQPVELTLLISLHHVAVK